MHDKYIQLSQKQTEKARMIISSLNLIEIWEKAGATINPVGSFRIGVLAKHRDIDSRALPSQRHKEMHFCQFGGNRRMLF